MSLWRIFGVNLMLLIFSPAILAVDSDCNYYQNMNVGPKYYVYNKEYPNYYKPSKNCLWVAVAPKNYLVQANCSVEMPNSYQCNEDQLLISLDGKIPNRQNSHIVCGKGNQTFTTTVSNISIALITSASSTQGKFLCTLQAVLPKKEPNCNCGWKNPGRIVGGSETRENEYPMMGALVNARKEIFCGATIIATKYALTAAHCFRYGDDFSKFEFLVGAHDVSKIETTAMRLGIENIIIHPNFNSSQRDDIAIVETKENIIFSDKVGPACLPFAYYQFSFSNQDVTILGWGTTEFTGPKSDVLLETDVDVLNPNACYNSVGASYEVMCTYKEGHDSCQSDSGGPVMWMDNYAEKLYLVGIISSGYACASNKPGLNTRVTSYLSWILSVTPDACYCIKGPKYYSY